MTELLEVYLVPKKGARNDLRKDRTYLLCYWPQYKPANIINRQMAKKCLNMTKSLLDFSWFYPLVYDLCYECISICFQQLYRSISQMLFFITKPLEIYGHKVLLAWVQPIPYFSKPFQYRQKRRKKGNLFLSMLYLQI